MSWDLSGGQGKKTNFTKFPVGVSRIRVLDEQPDVRWTHWLNQYRKSVNCPGRGCPIDEIRRQQKANGEPYTYGMSRRFAINIWNYETNQVEVMEQGITFMEDLRDVMTDIKEDGGNLSDFILKVRRRGTAQDDTSYRIDKDEAVPANELNKEYEKTNLREYFKPHTPEQILALINFTPITGAPTEFQDHWNEVMGYGQDNASDNDDTQTGGAEEIEIR